MTDTDFTREKGYPLFFGEWLKRRRKELDLTQDELAKLASCTVFALRKIEAGERRPSKQLAGLLARSLAIPLENQTTFIKVARGDLSIANLVSPARTASPDFHPAETRSLVLGNLPKALTPFIGREPELAAVGQLLQDPGCSLLTMAGPGGIGKTRLAIEAARLSQDLFPDGIWFVPLGSLNSPILIVPAIADSLEFRFQDPTNLQAQLHRYLRLKKALLILDNAEHLLEGVGIFAEILKACPQVKLLVTSRERLSLLSEWVFEIQGLPVPSNDQVEQFEAYSSIALFSQSARRARVGFEIREAERKWVRQICQTVEGLPLGIELSAAWVGMLSCEAIANKISQNFDFLSASMHDLPERHRSLRATLDHSWNLLTDEERLVLSHLSVFRGNFSLEAAQEICGANLSVLASLKNKSFLHRTDQELFSLHEIIRQYAELKLREDPGEVEQVKDRHAAYYVHCLSEWEQALQSSRQLETLNEMALVIDNLSQAWQHMVTSCRPGKGNEFCADLLHNALFSLSLFYEQRCRSLEAIPLFKESVEYLQSIQPEFEGTEDNSRFILVLGYITAYLGLHHYYISQYDKTREYLIEAIQLLEKSQSRVEKAHAQVMLASIYVDQGQVAEGVALLEHSRVVFREEGVKWWYALATIHLAKYYTVLGKLPESEALFQEGFRLVEPGDLRLELSLQSGFALVLFLQGDYERAEQLFLDSLQLSYQFGNFRFTYSILFDLGRLALATQRIELAIEYLQKNIQLLTEFEEMRDLAVSRLYLGKCFAARSDFPAARDQFQQTIKIGQELDRVYLEYFGLTNIARTYFMEDRTEEALKIALALKHCPVEYIRIQEENHRLLADLQAVLPKDQVEAVTKQVDGKISRDPAETAALAYALELAAE
jgi:predicted ATPase/transcriptional regulator with XRE-family HTH domain